MQSTLKLAKYLKPYWQWALLAPLLMLLEVAMDLMQPRMIQRIVDQGIAQSNFPLVLQTGLIMIGLAFMGAIGGVGCTIFSVMASQGFGTDLRGSLFRKVQTLSFGNLDELETGQLITRLTNDVTQVQEVVSMMLRIMVRAPLMLVGSLVMAIITSPRLALMLLVLMPLVGLILLWVIRRAYPMFGEVQRKLDGLNTVMQEYLSGVRVVKAFVRADREKKRFGAANENLMDMTIRAARAVAITSPAMMMAVNLGVAGVIWFGGIQVTAGEMHTGQLIAFVNYLSRTLMSLLFVSMLMMRLARAQASAIRIQEVMDKTPKIKNQPNITSDYTPHGRLAFEGVSFSYNDAESDPVLKNISFVAEPGKTVAILGATGSGKSSLIHLIPRFYDVTAGRVTIDEVDVRNMDERVLRQRIGIALQESILFSGTIRDNIRFGQQDASEEEVIAAAKAAQADEFIRGFTQGYETLVGQRGINLSGGQKQRIAIARALLKKPSFLILDDSTSSVDIETESKIETALKEILQDSARIVIAQRISTVLNADQILVLEDGKLAAKGAHRELLQTSPIYLEIYESQLGNGVNGL
jgi:ATP-binding cassette subfamily B multidrug efflux pump